MNISISLSGDKQLVAQFEDIGDALKDFRPVWIRTRQKVYNAIRENFASEGGASGQWAALTPAYAKVKQQRWGNKPILQASGRYYKSVTQLGGEGIYEEGPQEMTIGTNVPYAGFHQRGTGKMPARPIEFTPAQIESFQEPAQLYVRQLAQNARLKSLRGG